MRSKLAIFALTASLLSFASTAQAGIFDKTPTDGAGVYVSGFVGGAFPFDADFDGTQQPVAGVPGTAGADANVQADLDDDVYFGAAVGGRLPFKFLGYFQPRLELEVSHFETDVRDGSFNGGNQVFSGEQSQTFFLLNSYNDIRWKDNQRVVPYIGGGIGFGVVDTDVQYFPDNGVATVPTFAVRGEDTGFATVSAAGVTLNATDTFDIYVEGRYFKTYGIDQERRFVLDGADGFNADVDDDPDGLALTVGTRIKF